MTICTLFCNEGKYFSTAIGRPPWRQWKVNPIVVQMQAVPVLHETNNKSGVLKM